MRVVSGTFNGTGAAVYICIGFVPDWVRLVAVSDTECAHAWWSKHMRASNMVEGQMWHGTGQAPADYAAGEGISPYYGGDLLTSANQTSVTYGEGVYLGWDDFDYRKSQNAVINAGDAVSDDITTWTLDTSGNRTGHFNEDVVGTYIGAGSRIKIDGQWYVIESLTAGQGEAADEVTLNYAAASGTVECITGKYSMKPIAIGKTTPAGFKVSATADVNVNDEIQFFEAGTYDK